MLSLTLNLRENTGHKHHDQRIKLFNNLRGLCATTGLLPSNNFLGFFLSCIGLLLCSGCRVQILDLTLISQQLIRRVLHIGNVLDDSSSLNFAFCDYQTLLSMDGGVPIDGDRLDTRFIIRPTSRIPLDLSVIILLESNSFHVGPKWFAGTWIKIFELLSFNEENRGLGRKSIFADFNAEENESCWQFLNDSVEVNFRMLYSILYGLWLNAQSNSADKESIQLSIIAYASKFLEIFSSASVVLPETHDSDAKFKSVWSYLQLVMSSSLHKFVSWLKEHKGDKELWEIYLTVLVGIATSQQSLDSLGYLFEWWKSSIGSSSSFLVDSDNDEGGDEDDDKEKKPDVCSLSEAAKSFLKNALKDVYKIITPNTATNIVSAKPPSAGSHRAQSRPSHRPSVQISRAVMQNTEAETYATGIIASIEENISSWLLWASDSTLKSFASLPKYPTIIPDNEFLASLLEKISISAILKPSATMRILENAVLGFVHSSPHVSFPEEYDPIRAFPQIVTVSNPSNHLDVCLHFTNLMNKSYAHLPPTFVGPHICYSSEDADIASSVAKSVDTLPENAPLLHVVIQGNNFHFNHKTTSSFISITNEISATKVILLETNFVPFLTASGGVRFPMLMSGNLILDNFCEIFEKNYLEVALKASTVSSEHAKLVNRIRWLLLFFHTCVEFHLSTSIQNDRASLGVDTLIAAFDMVDEMYSLESNNADFSRRLIDVTGPKAGLCLPNPLHLVDFIVDCVYLSAAHSVGDRYILICIYKRLFSGKFYDFDANYSIAGMISIPRVFRAEQTAGVFNKLKDFLCEKEGPIEFIGRSLPEQNSLSRATFRKAVQKVHNVWKDTKYICSSNVDNLPVSTSIFAVPIPSPLSVRPFSNIIAILRESLSKILTSLPARIMTNTKDIQDQMTGHVNLLTNAYKRPPKNAAASQATSTDRRRGNKIVTRYQSREFDPLWAFVLSESLDFNKTVDSFRSQLIALDSLSDFALREELESKMAGNERRDGFAVWFNHIKKGLVPPSWLSSDTFYTHSVTLDEWTAALHARRKMISDWLVEGHPGVLKLNLLRSPSTLLHALKEKFSMNMDNAVEKAHLKVSLLDPATISPALMATLKDGDLNYGCNILVGDVYLHNCRYNFGEEDNGVANILPAFSSSAFGQVALESSNVL